MERVQGIPGQGTCQGTPAVQSGGGGGEEARRMGAGSVGGQGGGGTWAGNVSRNSSRQKLLSWTTPYVTQISNKVQRSTMNKNDDKKQKGEECSLVVVEVAGGYLGR